MPGFAAEAVDVLAEGEVELGEDGGVMTLAERDDALACAALSVLVRRSPLAP
jgi:hypothetical protein